MADIQRIPFHEDELYAITDDRTGKEYVLPKPMADMFGLTWRAQLAKLTKNKLFAKGTMKMSTPTSGGEQEALVLERRLVHAWLLSIDIKRVALPLQAKLLRYQDECASVLDAYFSTGVAINPRTAEVTGPWDMLAQMVEAGRKHAEQIRALEAQQHAQMAATIETQAKAIEALSASSRAEAKAEHALHGQDWKTLRQYVCARQLEHQLPPVINRRMAPGSVATASNTIFRSTRFALRIVPMPKKINITRAPLN